MVHAIRKAAVLVAAVFALNTVWGQGTRAFNQNASRSNHTRTSFTADETPQGLAGQNNNTVRSNRGAFIALTVVADLDGDGVYETDLSSKLAGVVQEEGYATVLLDGKMVAVIVNVLKTRHETAKNSISNIR